MSLIESIPGLSKHVAPPVVAPPAPPLSSSLPVHDLPLPHHLMMRSRHGIEYVLCTEESAVVPVQAAYPTLPVVSTDDFAKLKGFGPAEADAAMMVMAAMPGSRIVDVVRLGGC